MADAGVIGRSVPLREARDKVTGRARFVDDLRTDLSVKILGSPHPHAMIQRIDTSRAEQLEGVRAVLTHERVSDRLIYFGTHRASRAMDPHLRHVGDYVAAVAATSEAIAEAALALIEVEYEPLPSVFDPEEALRPEAPQLYPQGNDYASAPVPLGVGTPLGNLQAWGDTGEGFRRAEVIVEESYDVRPQVHSAIEPHVCMARWDQEGLTIWSPTHTPSELRLIAAHFFDLPQSRIVVQSPYIGGGFGGKYTGRYQLITCLLAQMVPGRSVKLRLSREESQCYARRPRGKLYAKLGAMKDGTLTAIDLKAYFDIGAYGDFHGGSNGFHCEGGLLSYKVPNARFEAFDVHTNHFRSECMRSVQVPFLAFAIDSTIDQLAERVGLDPADVRAKNMPESGDPMPPGGYTENTGLYPNGRLDIYPGRQLLREVLERIEWKAKWHGWDQPSAVEGSRRRGVGLAYSMGYGGFYRDGATSAKVAIHSDGSATVYSGAQELGQGINTTLCMLVAESLGVPLEEISIVTGDTRSGAYDLCGARSSHQLTTVGHVTLQAVENAKQQLRERAAPRWEAHPDQVEISGKKAWLRDHPETAIPLADLFAAMDASMLEFDAEKGWLRGHPETAVPLNVLLDAGDPSGAGKSLSDHFHPPVIGTAAGSRGSIHPLIQGEFKAHQPMVMAAEVEVDVETGSVRPLKLVTGTFPGRMINPAIVRGQALGGAAQTLGMALWEELQYDPTASRYLSDGFTNYRIPRVLDLPEIETVFVEEVDEESPPHDGLPFGGRGLGEMTAWGAVVIANAIYNATGVRMTRSPMTAEVVLEALAGRSG